MHERKKERSDVKEEERRMRDEEDRSELIREKGRRDGKKQGGRYTNSFCNCTSSSYQNARLSVMVHALLMSLEQSIPNIQGAWHAEGS
jgi:hypothetical protein